MCYNNLSPPDYALVTNLSIVDSPKLIQKALSIPS